MSGLFSWQPDSSDVAVRFTVGQPKTIVLTGPATGAKSRFMAALGGDTAALDDVGGGLGVSRLKPITVRAFGAERTTYAVRVTLRAGRAHRWDATTAARRLAEWLGSNDEAEIVLFDGVSDGLADRGADSSEFFTELGQVSDHLTQIIDVGRHGLVPIAQAGSIDFSPTGIRDCVGNGVVMVGPVTPSDSTTHIHANTGESAGRPALADGLDEPPGHPPHGAARYVNTLLAEPETHAPVPAREPLRPATSYELLVNIGAHDDRSLLHDEPFPSDLLPPGGLWLTVVVHLPRVLDEPWSQPVYLPESGASYVCDCPAGTDDHICTPGRHEPYVVVPLRTPAASTVLTARVVIYYRAAAVHVQDVTLPVGPPGGEPHAEVVYRLTQNFDGLAPFASRALSIVTGEIRESDRECVYVNGVSIEPMASRVVASQADNACRAARTSLFRVHLREDRHGRWTSVYGPDLGRAAEDYEKDLLALARVGSVLHKSIFSDARRVEIRQLLQYESLKGPATLQLARTSRDRMVVPWQLLYELPMQHDARNVHVCASVAELGPTRSDGAVPNVCPHAHPTGVSVLCPFGFWGLAYHLESPPDIGGGWHTTHCVGADPDPIATLMGWQPELAPLQADDRAAEQSRTESERHLSALKSHGLGVHNPVQTTTDLGRALAPSTMDVVYLYCHGERYLLPGSTAEEAMLQLCDRGFIPSDIADWPELYSWPTDHWSDRRPLVVLNACRAGDFRSETLTNFVRAFTETAGAAGVVLPEVALEQRLAGAAMEVFLRALRDGETVGAAMRTMRWHLLARGNVMGLAYTPYCVADLRLRA